MVEHAAGDERTAAIKASEPSSEPSVWASREIICERFRIIIDALPGGRNRAESLDGGSIQWEESCCFNLSPAQK